MTMAGLVTSLVLTLSILVSMVSSYNVTKVTNIYKSYPNKMFGGDSNCVIDTSEAGGGAMFLLSSEVARGIYAFDNMMAIV